MGQLPSIEYIAENSVPDVLEQLKQAGIGLRHIRGSIHDGPFGEEWDCRCGRAKRWLSFVVDNQAPGFMFLCIGHEPWSWWFLHRADHCRLDDALETAVQTYSVPFAPQPQAS